MVLTSSGVERISGATEGISFSGIGCETELRFELLRLMVAVETDDKFSRSNWSFSINLGGFSILGRSISTNQNEDMKTLLSNGHSFIIFHFLHDEIISYQSDHYTVRIS